MSRPLLAFAIDAASWKEAAPIVEPISPHVDVVKVGLELFCAEGPEVVRQARALELAVFLDLKLHDIPATVERAVGAVCGLGATYLTIHAAGGRAMVGAAVRRAEAEAPDLKVLVVTALTSLSDGDLAEQGVADGAAAHVSRLARLAWDAGARGFVCSPLEVAALRSTFTGSFLVTPGVRRSGDDAGDQTRTATPREARDRGSNMLVVGRPIRDAADPAAAARAIAAEVA